MEDNSTNAEKDSLGECAPGAVLVWAVEDGEYSDYHVVGVFSSQANAEMIAGRVGGTVSEWKVDPAVAELNQGLSIWSVQMQRDGTVDRAVKIPVSSYGIRYVGARMWRRSTAPSYVGKGVEDVLTAEVWAKGKAHAIKIVNEHRAEFIASGEWDNNLPAR